jgi:transcriptional regulator with XRE-family HTH domain
MTDHDEPARKVAERQLSIEAGRRLAWARTISGLTQQEIADLVGCSQGEWSRWERGVRAPPDPAIMVVACRRLRISMDYIYRGLLIGVQPSMADALFKAHPEALKPPPIYTGWSTDTDPA